MIRHGQASVIFLVNNRGYVSESAIHDGPYNYFKNWDYAGADRMPDRARRLQSQLLEWGARVARANTRPHQTT
jgi:TPP-dependent 2-oxoacid decarboxylase